jgi:hypothetical protein
MKKILIAILAIHFMCAGWALADTGIVETHRDAIQTAMANHIKDVSDKNGNGMFPIFDPGQRTVVQLKFDRFHGSVEIKGRNYPYFISCADFTDKNGTKYDLDFLVSKNHHVVAVLIHSINNKKTKYDIH